MDYFKWLDEWIAIFDGEVERQRKRLNELDWDEELNKMLEDDEYTALDFSYLPDDWYDRKIEIRASLTGNHTIDLRDHLISAEEKVRVITNIQVERLKSEYYKRDADLMPTLVCSTCAKFFNKQKHCYDHVCEAKTKCNNCGQNCKTKERLETHIQSRICAKKHQCKDCPIPFQTNSDAIWTKHTKSKEHKQSAGIKKEAKLFECKKCDRQYAFESDYTRHCLSVKHKSSL